jgi:hypothetical protein
MQTILQSNTSTRSSLQLRPRPPRRHREFISLDILQLIRALVGPDGVKEGRITFTERGSAGRRFFPQPEFPSEVRKK